MLLGFETVKTDQLRSKTVNYSLKQSSTLKKQSITVKTVQLRLKLVNYGKNGQLRSKTFNYGKKTVNYGKKNPVNYSQLR